MSRSHLDANTTVTLAEYIPDFFIRDNQVFKRSDDIRRIPHSVCK